MVRLSSQSCETHSAVTEIFPARNMKLTSEGQAGARNEEQREKKNLEGGHRGRKLEDVCRELALGKRGKMGGKLIESVNE